jgi:dTDP-4-amino-4,6-dideoxygalactose transaminase
MPHQKNNNQKFLSWPIYNDHEEKILSEVVKSGKWWCGAPGSHEGKFVWLFQEEFAKFQNAKFCIALANGTVAIESILFALGVRLGDEVIVSDYTFVASASAVIANNAIPIFCDINPQTFVMDVNKLEHLINKKTKAIIPVHLGGNPVEMDKLLEIARENELFVIEDCAHAHGSCYKGKKLGNWGNAGSFSFQASKVLTSGEGGAVICNSNDLADKIYSYIDCGRKKGHGSYEHFSYGTNYRMTEYQAAILLIQMQRFKEQHKLRNENARYLSKRLNEIDGINVMKPTQGTSELGWYVFPFLFDPSKFGGITKMEFKRKLQEKGIPCVNNYPPLHTLTCFREVILKPGIDYSTANWGGNKSDDRYFPIVSEIYSKSIEFPQELLLASPKQLDFIIEFIKSLQK